MSRTVKWLVAAGGVAMVAVAWWRLFDDSAMGLAVLGGYRESHFLLLLAFSWATAVVVWRCCARPTRRTVLRVVLLHAGVILPLLLLEALAWAGLVDFGRLLAAEPMLEPSAKAAEHGLRRLTKPNLDLHELAPADLVSNLGATAAPFECHFRTDRFGLRNPTPVDDPAVVCLGDSILVAGMVPEDDLLTVQLQRGLGLPVLNCAEPNFAPQEELRRLQATGIGVKGRLVVQFLFEGNDLGDSVAWRAWMQSPHDRQWSGRSLLVNLLLKLKRPRRHGGELRRASFRGADGPTDVWFFYDASFSIARHAAELPELESYVRETAAQVVRDGGGYAVCLVPMKLSVIGDRCEFPADSTVVRDAAWLGAFRGAVQRTCAALQVPCFDLKPALQDVAERGQLPYFTADTHLNAVGQRAMAEALQPWLQQLLASK